MPANDRHAAANRIMQPNELLPFITKTPRQTTSKREASDNGDEPKTFVCRLSKPKESTRIRITWLVASNIVRIEKVNGIPNHSHSIEENDMQKRSKFIRDM
ncbi:23202_t:CDS:2, partial [Racocetra persica]